MSTQQHVMLTSISHRRLSGLPMQQFVFAYGSSMQENSLSPKSFLPFIIKSKRSKRKSK